MLCDPGGTGWGQGLPAVGLLRQDLRIKLPHEGTGHRGLIPCEGVIGDILGIWGQKWGGMRINPEDTRLPLKGPTNGRKQI